VTFKPLSGPLAKHIETVNLLPDIICDTIMSQLEKLIESIRANPKDVRFQDACRAAKAIGFTAKGGKGAHCAFARAGEPELLNFQDRGGKIKPYQAKQLIAMINKYWVQP
jgi:hypothetical protein